MAAVTDLQLLLRSMDPDLWPEPWAILALVPGQDAPADIAPFAVIGEAEGTTLIATADDVRATGLEPGPAWARISLTIHSDLAAVGLTAALSGALAGAGISANIIAGYYHDHVFVPWDRRQDAMATLRSLAGGQVA